MVADAADASVVGIAPAVVVKLPEAAAASG